jgi:hypothetical protein
MKFNELNIYRVEVEHWGLFLGLFGIINRLVYEFLI